MLPLIFMCLISTWSTSKAVKVRDNNTDTNEYCTASDGCEKDGANIRCLCETSTPDCWYERQDLMTDEFIDLILSRINEERHKMGSDDVNDRKGEGNTDLPQAKIMHQLQWDSELAELSQILADRCDKHIDIMQRHLKAMCKTTDDFPHPNHIGEYATDHLIYGYNQDLTPERAQIEVVSKKINKWFEAKAITKPSDIQKYPDNSTADNNIFLNWMNGEVTHIGCHLSTYKEYSRDPNNQKPDALDLQCFTSRSLTKEKPVYCIDDKDPNCKCQIGYHKIDPNDFVCYPDKQPCDSKSPCRQIMLVMPIIKEVNAPPGKLRPTTKQAKRRSNGLDLPGSFNDTLRSNLKLQALQRYSRPSKENILRNIVSRRDFSNLRALVQDYMSKRRSASHPTQVPTPLTTVKISQRYKFDDVDRIIGAIRSRPATKAGFEHGTSQLSSSAL